MRVLSREQVRRLDQDAVQQLGLPSLLLMENAARGLSAAVRLLLSPPGSAAGVGTGAAAAAGVLGRIVIAAGAGNNGGDGLALARLLAAEGVPAEVLLFRCGRSLSPDAAANLGFLQRAGLLVSECGPQQSGAIFAGLSAADLIVDALLGTGVRGAPQEPLSLVIQQINASAARVLSVDLPSGLDCDLGTAAGDCVRADLTVTFAAMKRGFLLEESRKWTGAVQVCHIGIPAGWSGWPVAEETGLVTDLNTELTQS